MNALHVIQNITEKLTTFCNHCVFIEPKVLDVHVVKLSIKYN